MIQGSSRRGLRRITAGVAGAAVAAASIGLAAPAHAAESAVGGIVTDASGNPLSGFVRAYDKDSVDGTYSEFSYDVLDLQNGVVSGTLEDGTYKFEAVTTGGYSEYYLDKADLASADEVAVGGGAAGLSAWVLEQPYVVATITDSAGRPVEGSEVGAYDAGSGDIVAVDRSNEHGTVSLAVGSGPVKIEASGVGRLGGEWYNDKADFASADAVTGTPAGTPVAIALAPKGAVTGQVLSDAGAPLEQVLVEAHYVTDTYSYVQYTDYTDKNGVFVFDDMLSADYKLEFSDPYIKEYESEYWNNAPDMDTATKITVRSGQVVSGLVANLTPRPAKPVGSVELTGSVVDDAGVPVVGARIGVWNIPAGPTKEKDLYSSNEGNAVYTNRAGIYTVDSLDALSGKSVKVQALAPTRGDEKAYRLYSQWFGQHTSYDQADAVPVAAGVPTRADISLPRAGGISGTVRGEAGLALSGTVTVLSADGHEVYGSIGTEANDTFELTSLYPGDYKVMFSDSNGRHVPEWWKDSDFEDAKTITVKSGETVTGLDAVLDASLSTTERPSLKGYPWVGKKIRVDPGEWNLKSGTQFSYEWLIGNKVVGTGDSFEPTKKQIGDKLKVRVLAENGELAGTATTARSAKIGYKSKIKAKIRGTKATLKIKAQKIKGKKVKGKVTVKEIVKVKKNGDIKYKKVGKTKIKKGKGTVRLKLKKGIRKHKVVFFFKGKGKVGSSELTKKVKTKR